MRSVMEHQFSRVPQAEIQRSTFDRSHGLKTTFDSGLLIPIFVDEALPGDTFNLSMSAFARLATPLKPFMDNVFLDTFWFAVPYRLLWTNWERFNGEQINPGDSTDFVIPQIVTPATTGAAVGDLGDYFGIPTGIPNLSVSALPFRAYNLIYNEWFRDQNLQNSVAGIVGDGPDTWTSYPVRRRGKRHDYFTSCLPFPQKGPDVLLPLGLEAPIVGIGVSSPFTFAGLANTNVRETGPEDSTYAKSSAVNQATSPWFIQEDPANPGYPFIRADLSAATPSTINEIREAFQIQRLYERDARGGTRYVEILKAHFGVTSPDARLQRPEYLGGGSSPVNIHPVAQTSGSAPAAGYTDTPQGNLAAFGTASFNGHGFSKSFTEHCIIIGLASVRADLTYQQGLNRMWSRRTRFDFYWPALSHLGEQAVLNKEIYAQGTVADDEVFGYQERYAEYRYKPSQITGQFRSTFAQSLDVWHLAQDFGALPLLNANFIEENPPISRVVAVDSEPEFLFDGYFNLKCARPMPVFGVPGMIDHF